MSYREWETKVLWYYIKMYEWEDSRYRKEREYANYIKRFLFGDGEIEFLENETWKKRAEGRELPMPPLIYMAG